MLQKTLHIISIAILSFFISQTSTQAHFGAQGIVKERMENMGSISRSTKHIAPMAYGQIPPDIKFVKEMAGNIVENASNALEHFPKNSLSNVSEAKKEIWENWEEFSGYMKDMISSAEQLRDISQQTSQADITLKFNKMIESCNMCHDKFREKK